MSAELSTKSCGLLTVDEEVWPNIGSPETVEQWRKALLLPVDYDIEHIERRESRDGRRNYFALFVRHANIPQAANTPMSIVHPHYHVEHGEGVNTVSLDRIEIWGYQDSQWKQQ